MFPGLQRASLTVRAGLLGFVSGLLSCLLAESRIIYIAREQKTFDHVVWPGLVFALVVLLPLSRWVGASRPRIAAALLASSVVYPIAWRIAASSTTGPPSWALMIAAFALAGLLGSFVLAGVFFFRRPCWANGVFVTVALGAAVAAMMGANLRAAMALADWPLPARDGLALFVVLWQAVVGASLGRGVQVRSNQPATASTTLRHVPDAGFAARIADDPGDISPCAPTIGRTEVVHAHNQFHSSHLACNS